jgi:putative ABC transport system permease protein
MNALTKKAVRDVTRRKLRTTLTVLGIAVGVMGLTAISLASGQFTSGLNAVNDTTGQPDIQFFTAPTTASVADTISRQPNVKTAKAETLASARWAIPSGHEPLNVVGLSDFRNLPFQQFSLTTGAFPGPDEILMESSAQSVTPFKVGDTINLQAGASNRGLKVSGLAHTPGSASATFTGRASGYMRESDLQSLFDIDGSNVVLVRLDDYGMRTATAKQLAQVLGDQNVVVLQTVVGRDVSGGSSSTVTAIFTIMQLLSVVALLLTVFLLLSTVTTLVTEQVPVIGTMKAIGARGGQVLRNYLTGVALYGVVGTLIGFVLGIGLGDLLYRYFAVNLGMDTSVLQIGPSLVITAVLVGVGVPLVAATVPVFLGTRITVRQALAGYGLSTGDQRRGRGWSRLIRTWFGFLPQAAQLGLRSLFRRRARALLTVSALAISGAAFLAVQTTTSSWNAVLSDVFASYRADVFAAMNNPQPYSSVRPLLANVPGVAHTEPLSQTPVTTRWGTAVLTGVVPDPVLYHKNVVAGRWLTGSDRDTALISQDAAQRSGLKVGDTIDFHTDLYSAHWQIVGIAKDLDNPTGVGVLLTTQAQANAFYHLPADYAQSVMISSTSSKPADIDALAKRVDDTLGGTAAQANVQTANQQIQRNQGVFLILYALFYSVVAIIALVGGIGLLNSLAMGVLERRREIGILRSMGATGRKVAQVFWTEGVGLGIVSWVIAVVIGIPVAYGFAQVLGAVLLKSPFVFNPLSVLAMLVFIVAVASLATIGPVWSASRVRIAETLRYE